MDTRNILISIKEIYANQIKVGKKRVELRKSFPTNKEGARVYIYVPAPNKEIIGYFLIEQINRLPIANLWTIAGRSSSLSKKDFFSYFSGKDYGISIHFNRFIPFLKSLSLDTLRENHPKFHPPQSFIYLNDDIESLCFKNQSSVAPNTDC